MGTRTWELVLPLRSLLLTIIAFGREDFPQSPPGDARLCSPHVGPDDHDHRASWGLVHLCLLGTWEGSSRPSPSFGTAVLLGRCPRDLSSIPWIFTDAADAVADALPSPGKRGMLRHHPFLLMLTDHQAQVPSTERSLTRW